MSDTTDLDLSARYTVAGYPGIAFYLKGYVQRFEPYTYTDDDGEEYPDESGDGEMVDDTEWVRAVMVGDDQVHLVEIDDLTAIEDDEYCSECGQVGCGW